jgi:hypothetical protein
MEKEKYFRLFKSSLSTNLISHLSNLYQKTVLLNHLQEYQISTTHQLVKALTSILSTVNTNSPENKSHTGVKGGGCGFSHKYMNN